MSRQLLLVTLGPVQDFIAQARRTRDLWFGSHLLSELSRAAARELAQKGARLIFPALDANDEELLPNDGPLRSSGAVSPSGEPMREPPLAIPNKLLAEVPEGLDPEELAGHARAAANKRWLDFAAKVEHRCRGLTAPNAQNAWNEQIQTFLEFAAAWMRLPDGGDGYAEARRNLEAEIAGRKLLRDFPAWHDQRGTVPKSSLDGARETVLAEPKDRASDGVKRYRIASGEQLDAVGLVKRAGGEPDQFVPIANIALAGWIAAAKQHFADLVRDVERASEREGLGRVDRPDLACGRAFSFDAEVFLKDRWFTLLKETRGEPENRHAQRELSKQARDFGRQWVKPLLDQMNEPCPYVACLVADGDHMGRALEKVDDIEAHRRFSKHFSHFAGRARRIVEQDHRGILVYAGGDDALAFIGVAEALPCADGLRRAFDELAREAFSDLSIPVDPPTLSVGIGIGHLLESMGQLRRLGGEAEKLAKQKRNALAVIVDKRSGGKKAFCESWKDNPAGRLRSAAALLDTRLSMKKVHEIERELSRLPRRKSLLQGELTAWGELLCSEVERILARTGDGEGLTAAEAGLSWGAQADYDTRRMQVEHWVSRMLIAKAVAESIHAATPKERR